MNEQTASIARRHEAREREAVAITPEIDAWVDFLQTVLRSGAASRVGVLVHFYSGTLTGERISIIRRDEVALPELTPRLLLTMDDDVLYELLSAR